MNNTKELISAKYAKHVALRAYCEAQCVWHKKCQRIADGTFCRDYRSYRDTYNEIMEGGEE